MKLNKEKTSIKPVNSAEYSQYFIDLTKKVLENPDADPSFKKELDFFSTYAKKYGRGKDLLEIGCGTGRILLFLAKEGYNCFGIDFDPMQIEFANTISKEQGLKNIAFFTANIGEEIVFNIRFDVIISNDLIEHLPEQELLSYFLQVHNLLKPDGIFLIQSKPLKYTYLIQKKFVLFVLPLFFLPEKKFNRYLVFLDHLLPRIYKFVTRKNLQGTWQDTPPGHCNPPDDDIVRMQLVKKGFVVEEIRTTHPGTHRLSVFFRRIVKSKKFDTSISVFAKKEATKIT